MGGTGDLGTGQSVIRTVRETKEVRHMTSEETVPIGGRDEVVVSVLGVEVHLQWEVDVERTRKIVFVPPGEKITS